MHAAETREEKEGDSLRSVVFPSLSDDSTQRERDEIKKYQQGKPPSSFESKKHLKARSDSLTSKPCGSQKKRACGGKFQRRVVFPGEEIPPGSGHYYQHRDQPEHPLVCKVYVVKI